MCTEKQNEGSAAQLSLDEPYIVPDLVRWTPRTDVHPATRRVTTTTLPPWHHGVDGTLPSSGRRTRQSRLREERLVHKRADRDMSGKL